MSERKTEEHGRKIFTTVQAAKICKVAPVTIGKWFDSGRLRGYRIPGSQDRRIPREHLITFLKEHGMPLGDLEKDGDE
jgi:excisionase family DNA binding protein